MTPHLKRLLVSNRGAAEAQPPSHHPFAINPVTQRVYIAGFPSITVLDESQQTSPLTTTITPLADNATTVATPEFTFTAANLFQSQKLSVTSVYYQFDTWDGEWMQATPNGSGSFSAAALRCRGASTFSTPMHWTARKPSRSMAAADGPFPLMVRSPERSLRTASTSCPRRPRQT